MRIGKANYSELSSLSCDSLDSQSFLSCKASRRFRKLSNQKHKGNESLDSDLSCETPNLPESNARTPSHYRAEISKAQNAPLILGIDPGITGALAFISGGETPQFVAVYDFPLKIQKIGNRLKNRIDLVDLAFLIESYSKDINLACVEEVGQIGTKADPFSSFVFGFGTGLVHGILAANNIEIQSVKPLTWKAALGLDADKGKAIDKAIKLFPEAEQHLKRKKDHGRAEALLLAYFAWKLGGGK